MRSYSFLLVCVLAIMPLNSYSYNWNNCKKDTWDGTLNHFYGTGFFNFLTSSSQWSSSTGACSMLGQIEDQKKYFIAQNLDNLIIDSARGIGEYLNAYLSLTGCSQDSLKNTSSVIQSNFVKIYGEKLQNSPEQTYEQLENIFNGDPIIRTFCKIKV